MIAKPSHRPLPSTACPACGCPVITHDTAGSEHVRFEAEQAGAWLETYARMVRVGQGEGTHKLHECRRIHDWAKEDAA